MGKEERFGNKINTNGFNKNPQHINKDGRPLKVYNILKEKGYSKDDITAAFNELSFYTLAELTQLNNNDDIPIILRIAANQFTSALKKGDMNKIKEILEHVIGRPLQKSDITTKGESLHISDERAKEIAKLLKDEL